MKQLMVALIFIWTATVDPMLADTTVGQIEEDSDVSSSTSIVVIDDENRRHQYIRSPITGKAERVYPNLNALDFSDGREITSENVEQVSRKVLSEIEEFSHVDEDKLTLLRAYKSKLGMWIVSFEQIHRGFQVYGARYGVTIGRNNTVLVVGGDVYDIDTVQIQGIVNEGADQEAGELDILEDGPIGEVATTDLEVNPTVTSEQIVQDLLGNDTTAVIVDEPTLMIYPEIDNGITYRMGWVASVDYIDSPDNPYVPI